MAHILAQDWRAADDLVMLGLLRPLKGAAQGTMEGQLRRVPPGCQRFMRSLDVVRSKKTCGTSCMQWNTPT